MRVPVIQFDGADVDQVPLTDVVESEVLTVVVEVPVMQASCIKGLCCGCL